MSDYQSILNDLLEYQKLSKKLELLLISKEKELDSLNIKSKELFDQLKSENAGLKMEISALNQKLKETSDENDLLKEQIDNMKFNHEKEINSLKVIKSLDNNANKNSVVNRDDLLELEKIKNEEILSLKAKNVLLQKEKNSLEIKLKEYQISSNLDINKIELINKDLNKNNCEAFEKIKNEKEDLYVKILEEVRKEVSKKENNKALSTIASNWKQEKERYLKDIENIQKEYLEEIKSLKNENLILNSKITHLTNQISYKDLQMIDIQRKIDQLNITYTNLEKDNNILLSENNELQKEKADFKNNLNNIKALIGQKDEEFSEKIKNYEEEIKTNQTEINKYMEELDKKQKEINVLKNNYNKIKEEKKEIIDKFKNIDDEDVLKDDDNNLSERLKKYEIDRYIYDKNEEINSLNKYIAKIKEDYYQILDKKKYYKQQCKMINDKIDIIKKKLTIQQIQEIEKEIKEKEKQKEIN